MLKVSDIPKSWKDTLEEIQQICPSAVIAGGALRDPHLGKKVKDIDVFIQAGGIEEAEGLFERLGGTVPDPEDRMYGLDIGDPGAYPESMTEVVLVEDYPKKTKTKLPVQLIFTNWKTSRIFDRFDMSFCQIMFNGVDIIASNKFERDCDMKVINIVRCNSKTHLGSSIKRFARFQEKFKGWELALDGVNLK